MEDYQFWKSWKRITLREKAAINSVGIAKKLIFKEIPKSKIIAIYVKGSLARRELTKTSDVDFVVILKDEKFLAKLLSLAKKYDAYRPIISVGGCSIQELESGKSSRLRGEGHMNPARVVSQLGYFKIIYGKKLDTNKLSHVNDKTLLKHLVGAFDKMFLPAYEQKKMGFSEIIKCVFWLVEGEEKVRGHNPPISWKKLEKSIKDKNHIIHETLKYRNKKTKDLFLRKRYINKLKNYLGRLRLLVK